MDESSTKPRIEQALNDSNPTESLLLMAKTFKGEGMSQRAMYQLFTEAQRDHERDPNEIKYDAVLETLDVICGWCVPRLRLFDTVLPT